MTTKQNDEDFLKSVGVVPELIVLRYARRTKRQLLAEIGQLRADRNRSLIALAVLAVLAMVSAAIKLR